MKKVLMLSSVASMIDQFNMENICILQKKGYKVDVATNFITGSTTSNKRINDFKKELNIKNIEYYQIDFSRKISNIRENIKAYKQLKTIIKENNYNFIHCHSPIGGLCGRLACNFTKTKVIYTAHGFHFSKQSPKINWIVYYPIEKILSYMTDIIITINKEDYEMSNKKMKSTYKYYIPGIGINTCKIDSIKTNNEIKRKELNIPSEAKILLSVGELNGNKNHEIIIKALAEINDKNIHYCIAGKGKLDNYLEKLSNSLGLKDNVHILGFRDDVHELYKISDIFCFPSYREGLSVALMEAMASGLPVICSKIRGNCDLIKEGKGGYLCEPDSISQFKSAIVELTGNSNIRTNQSIYNKNYIKQFDTEVVNIKMETIYDSIGV